MLNTKKTKDDILSNLSVNLPVSHNGTVPEKTQIGPSNDDIIVDAEEDYTFARQHIKKLINTSDEAIATMHALASDAEHPRAFEVLSAMIKSAADMNTQLLSLQKDRKKIIQEPESGTVKSNGTTNNAIFVGTTTELQKLLKGNPTDSIDI